MLKDLRQPSYHQSPSSKSTTLVTVRGQREKRTNPAGANNEQAIFQKLGGPQPLLFSSKAEVSELSLGGGPWHFLMTIIKSLMVAMPLKNLGTPIQQS